MDLVVYALCGFFLAMYLNTFRACAKPADPNDPNAPKSRCPVSAIGVALLVAALFAGVRYAIIYFQREKKLTGLAKEIVPSGQEVNIAKQD